MRLHNSRICYSRLTLFLTFLWMLLVPVPYAMAASFDSGEQDKVRYRIQPVTDEMRPLEQYFTADQVALLERLNRVDRDNFGNLIRIIVPDTWSLPLRAYSPFPLYYPRAASHPKFLVIHQPYQVFGAYQNGQLVGWGPVSSGRKEYPTPSGLFHLNWRSRGRHSTVDPDWYMPWYFNFDNKRGLALHAYNLPGYPASHACIRMLTRDARWLYEWGEGWVLGDQPGEITDHGTPVLVVGEYDFDAPPPWFDPANPHPDIPGMGSPRISRF